jgi:glycosyltransferase involved in cell wall biosynthesis
MNRLRIAVVIPGIPLRSAGPSTSVRELTRQLCALGHKTTLVASNLSTGDGPPGEMIEIDSRVECQFFPATTALERQLYRSWAMKRWLDRHAYAFDVVDIQGVWSFTAIDAADACSRAGIPYILTPRGQLTCWDWHRSHGRKVIFYWMHLRRVLKGASAVRFLSEGEEHNSALSVTSPAVVIPNWVNATPRRNEYETRAMRLRLAIPEGSPIILFLGRIAEQKGVIEIVEAFALLSHTLPGCYLVLAGPQDKPYCAQLKRLMVQLAVSDNVRIIDPIYGDDKFVLLSLASIFITLSKNEGLPVAVLEAMALGLPAVVTKAANLPEIAECRAGILVEHSRECVADALSAMLRDEALLRIMSEHSIRLVRERFSPEAVVPRLLDLYNRVN